MQIIKRDSNQTISFSFFLSFIYSGIYLFEIVNCKGWLYGEEKSYNWTSTYFNNKEKEKVVFHNPIFNNKENIEKIQTLLG